MPPLTSEADVRPSVRRAGARRPSLIAAMGAALLALGGCADSTAPQSESAGAAPSPETLLAAALAAPHRSDAARSRDEWRHPAETLSFFGIAPDMTVVEVWPGGGWYTDILGPYLRGGGGRLYAATVDPARSEFAAAAHDSLAARTSDASVYGDVQVTVFMPAGSGPASGVGAPAGSADAVLTFRNAHNWIDAGVAPAAFGAFHAALKPGGVLGVVDHRARPDAEDGASHGGYVTERTIISLAEEAGFVLEARSDVNANPADAKDHPFGVWTLPPVSRRASAAGLPDEVDRGAYAAIGESDRMTLKFRKPRPIEPMTADDGPNDADASTTAGDGSDGSGR